jgi:hypothetical protein
MIEKEDELSRSCSSSRSTARSSSSSRKKARPKKRRQEVARHNDTTETSPFVCPMQRQAR